MTAPASAALLSVRRAHAALTGLLAEHDAGAGARELPGDDIAADLTALYAWIDDQLADDLADRQSIAEAAAIRIRDLALQAAGLAELAALTSPPPLRTEVQAAELPEVRAAYDASRAADTPGALAECSRQILDTALASAGVELGAYDRRIVAWVAGHGPEYAAVFAGIIARAASGGAR